MVGNDKSVKTSFSTVVRIFRISHSLAFLRFIFHHSTSLMSKHSTTQSEKHLIQFLVFVVVVVGFFVFFFCQEPREKAFNSLGALNCSNSLRHPRHTHTHAHGAYILVYFFSVDSLVVSE